MLQAQTETKEIVLEQDAPSLLDQILEASDPDAKLLEEILTKPKARTTRKIRYCKECLKLQHACEMSRGDGVIYVYDDEYSDADIENIRYSHYLNQAEE